MIPRSLFIFFLFFPILSHASDSTIVRAGFFKKNLLHRLLFGKHYAEVWNAPVSLEVFNIDSVKGGLKPVELGGNYQTITLKLEGKDGKQYVLRNINKDPSRSLPAPVRKQFLIRLLKECNTAENPYAPPVVAAMEEYAGIYHSNPRIVYVPRDERLGAFKDVFGNTIVLFEEKPSGDHSSDSFFGNSKNIVTTPHFLKKIYEDTDHEVDERLFAKVRLFDMLISDWGRHEDQWRWASFEYGKKTIYKPIPRDRDHAFYKFDDGLFPWIVSSNLIQPKFQSMNKDFRNVIGLNLAAYFLDHRILNSLNRQDWLEIADSLAKALPDHRIDQAMKLFPASVYPLCSKRISSNLKRRRNLLSKVASTYYLYLAKHVELAGTDKNEKFLISMHKDSMQVQIFRLRKNEEPELKFARTFLKKETRRIVLRGLGGNDAFEFEGRPCRRIRVTAVGGEGADEYENHAEGNLKIRILKDQDDQIGRAGKWKILKENNHVRFYDRKGFRKNQLKVKRSDKKK
ncbi:MAG: hypothetical protein ACJ75J_16065 [Cytophagaceae bacterium]